MRRLNFNKLLQAKSFLKSQILETDVSNIGKLTLTVPKIHYKSLSNENFQSEFSSAMERYGNISFADFHSEFLYLLAKHVPVKKKHISA